MDNDLHQNACVTCILGRAGLIPRHKPVPALPGCPSQAPNRPAGRGPRTAGPAAALLTGRGCPARTALAAKARA